MSRRRKSSTSILGFTRQVWWVYVNHSFVILSGRRGAPWNGAFLMVTVNGIRLLPPFFSPSTRPKARQHSHSRVLPSGADGAFHLCDRFPPSEAAISDKGCVLIIVMNTWMNERVRACACLQNSGRVLSLTFPWGTPDPSSKLTCNHLQKQQQQQKCRLTVSLLLKGPLSTGNYT